MARPLRIDQAGAYYHVLSRGQEGGEIYSGVESRRNFLERLSELPGRFGIVVHGYVLMGNHYHLLLQPRGLNLSQAIQWLNVGYSIWFNLKYRRSGSVFQGRFKSVLIAEESQLNEITRYLHLNPVRIKRFGLETRSRKAKEKGAGQALDAQAVRSAIHYLREFRWSSYRSTIGLEKAPDWLDTRLSKAFGRKGYRDYVEQGIRLGMPSNPCEETVIEGYLGSREALEKLREKLRGNRREQKGLRQLQGAIPWEKIVKTVERLEGKGWSELCGAHGNPGRDLGLLAGRLRGGLGLRELGEKAGGLDYPAVSVALKRLGTRLKTNQKLKRKWENLAKMLNVET